MRRCAPCPPLLKFEWLANEYFWDQDSMQEWHPYSRGITTCNPQPRSGPPSTEQGSQAVRKIIEILDMASNHMADYLNARGTTYPEEWSNLSVRQACDEPTGGPAAAHQGL